MAVGEQKQRLVANASARGGERPAKLVQGQEVDRVSAQLQHGANLHRLELPEIAVLGSSAIPQVHQYWPNQPPVSPSFLL